MCKGVLGNAAEANAEHEPRATDNRDSSGNLDSSSAKGRADMAHSLSVTEVTSPDR